MSDKLPTTSQSAFLVKLLQQIDIVSEKQSGLETVRSAILQRIGKFTKSDLMELCPSIGKATIENALKKLIEQSEMERHGSGKNTFYTRK